LATRKTVDDSVPAPRSGFNKSALNLVNKLIDDADRYMVTVEEFECGATLVDAGLTAQGGFQAGEIVTEICQCGNGKARIMPIQYEDTVLISVFVTNDCPAQSILGSQFTGWHVRLEGFSANASGPGRALAKDPDDPFHKLLFGEESNVAVLLLETDKKPQEAVVLEIAEKCGVSPENLFLIAFSVFSETGSILACARVIEAGLLRLVQVGLDPLLVRHAWGYAPIVSFVSNPDEVKERIKASILCGGVAGFTVEFDDDERLRTMVNQAHGSALKMFQEAKRLAEQNPRYKDLFQEAEVDLLKIDPNVVAPAMVTISSLKTGRSFSAGKIDVEALKRALGIM
jgi:methenyltetrahydromethanopterin cyclohydrolase